MVVVAVSAKGGSNRLGSLHELGYHVDVGPEWLQAIDMDHVHGSCRVGNLVGSVDCTANDSVGSFVQARETGGAGRSVRLFNAKENKILRFKRAGLDIVVVAGGLLSLIANGVSGGLGAEVVYGNVHMLHPGSGGVFKTFIKVSIWGRLPNGGDGGLESKK